MKQFNVIHPRSEQHFIYNGENPKDIAMKIFKKLYKQNKVSNIRICLEENKKKTRYYFAGTTKKKLDKYENILYNNFYKNKSGGAQNITPSMMPTPKTQTYPMSVPNMIQPQPPQPFQQPNQIQPQPPQPFQQPNQIQPNQIQPNMAKPNTNPPSVIQPTQPKQPLLNLKTNKSATDAKNEIENKFFVKNINSVVDNLALSIQEISKLINEKYTPKIEEENAPSSKLLVLVETGIKKLDTIEKNMSTISNNFDSLQNEVANNNEENEKKKKKKNKNCVIM